MDSDAEAVVARLIDKDQIIDLVHRYSYCVDHRLYDEVIDLFTEDCVVDYGPGIAPEHVPRLTERFYRVDVTESRAQGGTGLGLALVKHILNRHRGRLSIESVLGAGATLTVHLPTVTGEIS